MRILPVKEIDIETCSRIVGLNYSRKYQNSARKEIEAMFRNYVYKPQYLVAKEGNTIRGFAGYIQSWMDYHIYQKMAVRMVATIDGPSGIPAALRIAGLTAMM